MLKDFQRMHELYIFHIRNHQFVQSNLFMIKYVIIKFILTFRPLTLVHGVNF